MALTRINFSDSSEMPSPWITRRYGGSILCPVDVSVVCQHPFQTEGNPQAFHTRAKNQNTMRFACSRKDWGNPIL